MAGDDLVRIWKDPDERGDAAHPAGDISLSELSGAGNGHMIIHTADYTWMCCGNSVDFWRCPPEPPWPTWPPQPGPCE